MVSQAAPKKLTLHAVKKLCETKNLSEEFRDVWIFIQVVDVTIFDEEKKNIRGRLHLSDGVSKMICMIPDKVYQQVESQGTVIRKFDIWKLNAGKQQVQTIQKRPVMVLKHVPEIFGQHVNREIGSPQDYQKNLEGGDFPSQYDLSIPTAGASKGEELNDDDLAGALGDMDLGASRGQGNQVRRSYKATSELASGGKIRGSNYNTPSDAFMPIKALNQFSTDWVIKARLVKKGDLRNWKNAKGEGKLVNVDLIDKEGTLIQATGFNETAERLVDTLQYEQVYTFSGGQIKLANKRYTSIKNDFCITFDQGTVIEKCANDAQIKSDSFSFTKLEAIEALVQQCTIDVVGIILEVGSTSALTLKSGESRDKRLLTIGDEGNVSIAVTLWGDVCEAHDFLVGKIVALKGCRVSEYNGKSLNASSDTMDVIFSPKHPRTLDLEKFAKTSTASKMKTEMRTLSQSEGGSSNTPTLLIEELVQFCSQDPEVQNGKVFYANLICDIAFIFTPRDADRFMFYLACPSCKKKVMDDGNGYRCENCNKSYQDAIPTYNFAFKVQDCSGETQLQCLGDTGDQILGMSCLDLHAISSDLEQVREIGFSRTWRKIKITVRAKADQSGYSQTEDGTPQIRFSTVRVHQYSAADANVALLKRLKQYKDI